MKLDSSKGHLWTAQHVAGRELLSVSGRGVGMDVVKRNIEGLGGTVSIKTVTGKGTTFTLKLPLTLAIIEGMTVRVGQDTYIVPLLSILESIQPKREMLKTIVGKGELVNVRGTYLPLMRLYDVFQLEPERLRSYEGHSVDSGNRRRARRGHGR